MSVSEARVNLGYTLYPELAAAGLRPEEQLKFARFRFWRVLIPCAAWYSFYYLGRLNWGICLPWIIEDLGISHLSAGMSEAALLWGYAAATFFAGRASDRFGARLLQTLGGVGTTIMNILIAFQSTATGVVVFMWGNGLVQGLASAPTTLG
jgi:OPA family glycerol-3-phosphate transporter-like MFS transporter